MKVLYTLTGKRNKQIQMHHGKVAMTEGCRHTDGSTEYMDDLIALRNRVRDICQWKGVMGLYSHHAYVKELVGGPHD